MLEPNAAAISVLQSTLDESERARADRFRVTADRDSYIAAHALLRAMLSKAGGVAASGWRFQVAAGGKPEIDPSLGRPDLRFSLSHTRGMVACAVGCGHTLGIDAEAWKEPAPLQLVPRIFAPAERALIASAPPSGRAAIFYRLWTLKEAYLKATGQGITVPLNAVSFGLDPVSIAFAPAIRDRPEAWHFAEFRPGPAHSMALAVRRPAADPMRLDAVAVSLDKCVEGEVD
jgi:4'-phosphopantetheinyl transferase